MSEGGGSVVCMTQTQSFRYGIELCTGLCTVVCTALYTTIFEMLSAPLLQDLGLNFEGGEGEQSHETEISGFNKMGMGTGQWALMGKDKLATPPNC